jgi:twinfilin
VLEPKAPLFLVLRHSDVGLVALTYIPSNAGVRAKTLFASTRATLTRELGSEKFVTAIFATEEEEVFGEDAWKERDLEGNGTSNASYKREDLMDDKERELEAVRRAEEDARHGTAGRDVGTGGSLARVSGIATGGGIGVNMPVEEDAKTALRSIQDRGLVQLVSLQQYPGEYFIYLLFCWLTIQSPLLLNPKLSHSPLLSQMSLRTRWPPRFQTLRRGIPSIIIPSPMW